MQFLNHRGTVTNIKLIQSAVILNMHLKLISSDELRHGINAYTLTCRETKQDQDMLELNYDRVSRALRVSSKPILT
jgi:hypothetical protein